MTRLPETAGLDHLHGAPARDRSSAQEPASQRHSRFQAWCTEVEVVEDIDFCPLAVQDSLIAARDLRQRLAELIGELPAEQQHVLELTFFGELSQRRMAALTGIPPGTIKTRLALAINKLARKSDHLREDL